MIIANRREADDLLKIVEAIVPSGRSGIEPPVLALRASLSPTRVERLLKKHTDYFVRVGSADKFVLNRFGGFEGSATRISDHIEKSYARNLRHRYVALLLIALMMLILGANNPGG